MTRTNEHGSLTFEEDEVVFQGPQRSWRVPIAELAVIGEFTNDHGPAIDDYFLVFITSEAFFEAPFYAEGCDAVLVALGKKLGHDIRTDLLHSTTFASRVMWPARLDGHPLFDLVSEPEAGTLLGRVRQRLLPRVHLNLTDEVRRALGGQARPQHEPPSSRPS